MNAISLKSNALYYLWQTFPGRFSAIWKNFFWEWKKMKKSEWTQSFYLFIRFYLAKNWNNVAKFYSPNDANCTICKDREQSHWVSGQSFNYILSCSSELILVGFERQRKREREQLVCSAVNEVMKYSTRGTPVDVHWERAMAIMRKTDFHTFSIPFGFCFNSHHSARGYSFLTHHSHPQPPSPLNSRPLCL